MYSQHTDHFESEIYVMLQSIIKIIIKAKLTSHIFLPIKSLSRRSAKYRCPAICAFIRQGLRTLMKMHMLL